ncbi:RND family efflux transporter, MFP subunit [Monaibacterium marinum]|uniref:RND family efflux transporter, MFP subunit n=1 Tax=Pontivivens marinum TaxID=1690039 RepID=A0A2C9CTX6_9RHOB|nr:efflux RND transporter periplasmic adaptor subunit [Monaibacterium marinum]SOH93839.1 RND family efflux transporter, MFP subunit [Monaibacterium marinum]
MKYIALSLCLFAAPVMAQEQFDCVMDPAELVQIGSPVAGLLARVNVSRGQWVQAGDVIAELTSEFEMTTIELLEVQASSHAALDAQRAGLALIEGRYARTQELMDRGVATQDAMAEVEAELVTAQSLVVQAELEQEIARRELERARAALAQRVIHSPIDGLVFEKRMTSGEYLTSDGYVASLVQLDPLHVEAFLPVELFADVAEGQVVTIRPSAPIGGEYQGTITVRDRVFDAASGTFGVRVELPNPDGALPAGHRCFLELE